jgi:hypothetical protein
VQQGLNLTVNDHAGRLLISQDADGIYTLPSINTNTNPHTGSADTQQGGNVAWTVSNASTVTIASGTRSGETLSAVNNDAVLIYVADGFSNAATYAFSDGTTWKKYKMVQTFQQLRN